MKHEVKYEEGKIKVALGETFSVDKDKDGKPSVKGDLSGNLEIDALEAFDELAKDAAWLQKLKDKVFPPAAPADPAVNA